MMSCFISFRSRPVLLAGLNAWPNTTSLSGNCERKLRRTGKSRHFGGLPFETKVEPACRVRKTARVRRTTFLILILSCERLSNQNPSLASRTPTECRKWTWVGFLGVIRTFWLDGRCASTRRPRANCGSCSPGLTTILHEIFATISRI